MFAYLAYHCIPQFHCEVFFQLAGERSVGAFAQLGVGAPSARHLQSRARHVSCGTGG